jgi:type I restriction enzyme S subunit
LTADWREKNNLNFNFTNVILKDVCYLITKGTTPDTFVADGIPFFKMYNMVNGKIDFEYKPQYISAEIHNTTLKRSIIYPNDVLLNIVGPPLGKVAIVPSLFLEANINQAIALFRTKEIILPQYLYYFLLEGEPIRNITFETKGDAGQSNISLQQCRLFQINLPQKEEQIEIVRQVELLFAIADKAQKQYETAMEYFQKLEKSVLLQAFSGELVEPQAQTESLEDLLERIKIERERLEKEKKVLRKEQAKFKQQIKNMEKKSIEEILKDTLKETPKQKLSVEEIWQASVYFENKEVEKFYEELCKLYDDKKIDKNFLDDKKITTTVTLQKYAN